MENKYQSPLWVFNIYEYISTDLFGSLQLEGTA